MSRLRPLAAALALAGALPAQGIALRDLPALLRERAARQRPEQEAALQPFLADLSLDRRRSTDVVDSAIDKAANLGDGVVPILLEKLVPARDNGKERYLAENCARVLTRLAPVGFIDSLIDLAGSENALTRSLAVYVLGYAGHPRAAAAIARAFPSLEYAEDRRVALDAMRRLESPLLIGPATALLATEDVDLRSSVLRYLREVGATQSMPQVIEALRNDRDNPMLPLYVAYFAALARENEAATDALLPLVQGVRLDPEDLLTLVTALGDIAPKSHKEVRTTLRDVILRDTSRLGRAAALSLDRLGDKKGARELFDQLEQKLKKRRSSADLYADRGDAYAAFGEWRDAVRDYEQAIENSQTESRRAYFHLQIARCEAHRDNPSRVARALRDAGVGLETIQREAAKDPVFTAMLDKDTVQRFLRTLERQE